MERMFENRKQSFIAYGLDREFRFDSAKELRKFVWNLAESRELRRQVIERDGGVCVKCGIDGRKIYVHHKKKLVKICKEFMANINKEVIKLREILAYKEFFDVENLVSVCSKCHPKFET